jgi:hypothetical protein
MKHTGLAFIEILSLENAYFITQPSLNLEFAYFV